MAARGKLVTTGTICFLLGCLLAPHLPFGMAQEVRGPRWLYGCEVRVRRGGEAEFTKDTRKLGIEVFRDPNSNNLIYVTQDGAIAVAAAPPTEHK